MILVAEDMTVIVNCYFKKRNELFQLRYLFSLFLILLTSLFIHGHIKLGWVLKGNCWESIFYRLEALPVAQSTMSHHWRRYWKKVVCLSFIIMKRRHMKRLIETLIMSVCRNDPLVCLNYAVFLYNTGDKAAAASQFHNFEKRLKAVASNDVDSEVIRWLAFL